MTGQSSNKHHFVPACYTKRWAGTDKLLWEYQRFPKGIVARPVHPNATGFEVGLYSVPGVTPEKTNAVEDKFMKRVDQEASDCLDAFIEGRPLTDAQRSGWTRFLMTMRQRPPERLAEIAQEAKAIIEGDLEAQQAEYERRRQPGYPETFLEAAKQLDPNLIAKFGAVILQRLSDHPGIGKVISDMEWTVFKVLEGEALMTSDRPLIISNGLAKLTGWLLMPISPTHLFVATKSTAEKDNFAAQIDSGEFLPKINHVVVSAAQRFVYGVDGSQVDFVAERMTVPVPD